MKTEKFYVVIPGDPTNGLPSFTQEVTSLLGMQKYLTAKYGEGYKGSMLNDEEIDKLQELKEAESKNFYNYR